MLLIILNFNLKIEINPISVLFRYERKSKSISIYNNGKVTNVEDNLVEGLEEVHFNTRRIIEVLRLGKYILEDKDYAYSFSGKITDFNAWSERLRPQYLKDWMNCDQTFLNKLPDLGLSCRADILTHWIFQLTGTHRPLTELGLT